MDAADCGTEWSARVGRSIVKMPDGSIVLMGGQDITGLKNDVWRSTDNGASWTLQTAGAEWSARRMTSSMTMPDGSIVLVGGQDITGLKNDVWRSTDNGASWILVTDNAPWSARRGPSIIVMMDGSIILMGGADSTSYKNDVWRSMDRGASWTLVTNNAPWSERANQKSVAMPDGSIVLMGGSDSSSYKNDVWRSTDNGSSWTPVTNNAPWSARDRFGCVAMPDGSIVLMGGSDSSSFKNDVWRLVTAGSSEKNPSHIYNSPGIYQVSLQAYNSNGINVATKIDYITVKEAPPVAGFSGIPISGNVPLTVAFTDKSTGIITSFKWNFGDGATSTDKNPLHKYTVSGRYTVTLTVSNSAGSNTMTKQNYITADKALAPTGFSGKPTSGTAPLTVSFTDLSSNNPNGWAWYFGDETYTAPWTLMKASAEWSARSAHRSVTMPDGSIILMGGQDNHRPEK